MVHAWFSQIVCANSICLFGGLAVHICERQGGEKASCMGRWDDIISALIKEKRRVVLLGTVYTIAVTRGKKLKDTRSLSQNRTSGRIAIGLGVYTGGRGV